MSDITSEFNAIYTPDGRLRCPYREPKGPYRPRAEQEAILDRAWAHIQGVPYRVTLRWDFYRLFGDGTYPDKGDYHNKFVPLVSEARRRSYKGWRPDTLADDTRAIVKRGLGYEGMDEWLDAIPGNAKPYADRWVHQDASLLVCFEAAAMAGQFRYYLPNFVPYLAFHGDVSIDAKWEATKFIENLYEWYSNPVTILYFGDLDVKGLGIPSSALADVFEWSGINFDFIRVGLNPDHVARFAIPENPEKPGSYQWESLDDASAATLIREGLDRVGINGDIADACDQFDAKAEEGFSKWWEAEGREGFEEFWRTECWRAW